MAISFVILVFLSVRYGHLHFFGESADYRRGIQSIDLLLCSRRNQTCFLLPAAHGFMHHPEVCPESIHVLALTDLLPSDTAHRLLRDFIHAGKRRFLLHVSVSGNRFLYLLPSVSPGRRDTVHNDVRFLPERRDCRRLRLGLDPAVDNRSHDFIWDIGEFPVPDFDRLLRREKVCPGKGRRDAFRDLLKLFRCHWHAVRPTFLSCYMSPAFPGRVGCPGLSFHGCHSCH